MSLAWRIAARYLRGAKSHRAINAITWVAACGIAIITTALICALSVYNGFEDLVGRLCSNFDPDLRIEASRGKHFSDDSLVVVSLCADPDVESVNRTLEETVLLGYNGRQLPARMKGVDEAVFPQVANIEEILRSGTFQLSDEVADYSVLGAGLAAQIGVGAGFLRPLSIYCPRRAAKIDLLRPEEAFREGALFCSGVFAVEQVEYDDQLLITSLPFARALMGDSVGLLSAYELKLRPHASAEQVKRRLAPKLGADYRLLTQLEQQADSFKIMQIEKWITFLIILFILLIASFNVIGALSMLIIDKEQETETLRTLGATDRMIRHIFQAEGALITGSGAAVGLLLGILLCWAQEQFGLIKLGDGSGMFIIDSYPVSLRWSDIGWTALSVFVLGALATIYPLRSLRRQSPR